MARSVFVTGLSLGGRNPLTPARPPQRLQPPGGGRSGDGLRKRGKKLSDRELKDKDFTTAFVGDSVTITVQGQKKDLTYKLDPSQMPKHIDLVTAKGDVVKGIYLLDGDTLKLCARGKPGGDRPTEFKSEGGSSIGLVVFKRQ